MGNKEESNIARVNYLRRKHSTKHLHMGLEQTEGE